ncbi:pentahemic C cytochrome [Haemophilus paraphrohaemolyticus]|uniref:Pentahemic C cytochrome n=1 Tax=Haemophilus paraphrohaemolyticus TaxID=736 RepID=A0A369ZPD5_9PAST|nr:pentahemic C cytochrome [Haemophilus paraphrohaemolyticus]RDF10856.1 pentahemic C cytochrome [Haemophilus paraphrohaemolyticus]
MKMRFSSLFSSLILSFSFAIFSQNSTAFPSSYTPESLPLYADEALSNPIGELEAGVPVKLVQTTQNADQLELEMWRKTKGFGRIWYNQFAKHITDAVFDKTFTQNAANFEVLENKEDPLTGLVWQKVKTKVWVKKSELSQNLTAFWANAESTFKTECSVCHKQRDPKMHDANEWVAVFNGMVGFTDMDKPQQKQVLRYLQLHAADASK